LMLNTRKIYLLKVLGNTLVFNIKYFTVFCVNKYSHIAQHKVFPSMLCQ
jgi:hypothetical protein